VTIGKVLRLTDTRGSRSWPAARYAREPELPMPTSDPPTPQLETRYINSMTAKPSTVRPGSVVTLGFPDQRLRGLGYSLESATAAGWRIDYYLVAARKSEEFGPKSWVRAGDDEGFAWPSVGMTGPGGERVIVPDVALPGVYRLCTADPENQACTLITVK
jgi:hypothetical protein